MNRTSITLLLAIFFMVLPAAHAIEQVSPAQLKQIETLQHRAEQLAFGELSGSGNYHLSKARAWLDLAQSEYYEKDTSGTLSAAIAEATRLLDALENKQANISMDTPAQIPGSEVIRTDLGEQIAKLKNKEHFECGQQPLATAEVYLVWAGHEFFEQGQAHAESYVRSVENLIYDGKVAIDNCAAALIAAPPLDSITLSGDALFAFNSATLNPSALWQLDNIADNIKAVTLLEEVILVGHTDRLRSDGHPERNQILSENRAESIKRYLVGKGIQAEKIHATGVGSAQPLVECSTRQSKAKQIQCLQPNRRVEITLRGTKGKPPEKEGTQAGESHAGENSKASPISGPGSE